MSFPTITEGASEGERFIRAISTVLGWIYVLAWSLSFYPQPILNVQRRSTRGLAIDFPILNLLGFASYTISSAAFLYSPAVRRQYAAKHPLSPEPTVRFNDLAFAVHALVICSITLSQFLPWLWNFEHVQRQRASFAAQGIFWGSILGVLVTAFIIWTQPQPWSPGHPDRWGWLDVVYALGYVKLICTMVKYCPQAYFNYKRKSTAGWSIDQILLDMTGGIFSLLQLIIDSSFQGDWSGLTGNPVKFGLSNISLFFDVIFMTQHYVLYRHRGGDQDDAETGPLLA